MINILFLLLSKGKVTSKYIASRFDISVRTVMRYIDAMSLANIPLISDTGRNGGYYIADSFKIPASFLTEKELSATLNALNAHNQQVPSALVNSAITKLAAINRPSANNFEVKTGNIIIDGSAWNGNDDARNTLRTVEDAIENNLVLKIKYFDRNGVETVREIEPHLIVLKQAEWYVYAFCRLRDQFRMFKIARIVYSSKTENSFTKRETDFSLDSLSKWFDEMRVETVEIEAEASAESEVVEWLGVRSVYKRANGKIYASAKLNCDNWVISKILGFGVKVKVISPLSLKNDVVKTAEKIAENA